MVLQMILNMENEKIIVILIDLIFFGTILHNFIRNV